MKLFTKLFTLLILVSGFSLITAEDNHTTKPLTTGFNHVGLSVLSLEQSTDFFTKTLGWTLKGRDDEYPASFLSDGEMFLTLWQVKP